MGYRLSKICTRTGDDGTTSLGDGSRIAKDSQRIRAIGDVDELNSIIGLVLAGDVGDSIRQYLTEVQHDLFNLGAELSVPARAIVTESDVQRLERNLEDLNKDLPPLKEFVLPGGGVSAATCHLARAICRRTERTAVALAHTENVNPQCLIYLNRLSDLLFVVCRVLARDSGSAETLWRPATKKKQR